MRRVTGATLMMTAGKFDLRFVGIGVAAWMLALTVMACNAGANLLLPLASGLLFGGIFPCLAWWLTSSLQPRDIIVSAASRSLMIQFGYVLVFSIVVLGWGFGAIAELPISDQARALVSAAVKVITMVVLPLAFVRLGGDAIRPLLKGGIPSRKVAALGAMFAATFILVIALVTPSLELLRGVQPSLGQLLWGTAATIVWVAVTAGLTEEVMFRAVLQTRLAAVLSTTAACVVIAALIFALAHVPGLYLRADQADSMGVPVTLVNAIAYAIAVLGPPGVFFGVLWSRTQSLVLLIVAHASIDVLPNLPEVIRLWR
jgi:membrane protease YdiL (CAAX protease family)